MALWLTIEDRTFGELWNRLLDPLGFMKKKEHPLDEPGQQWSWKITLTVVCAVVGAVLALYLFGVL